MERAIDPLLTIDAKLWADEFMATKQRLGDAEFDHAMMLGWFANAIMQGYDEGQRRAKADAQATIEALQARVRELEEWVQDQSTANLETMRHMDEMQSRAMDAESQLTQRTAELEAIETILDIDSGKTTVEKVRDLKRSFDQAWASYQDASNEMFKAQAELERVRGELAAMRQRKDGAYLERNRVVAALASCFPSGIARTAIEGWDEEWHGCVYIDLPVGQVSWHYHDSHAHVFAHLPPYIKPWDGHTTEEKYERVALLKHRQGMEG